MYFYKMNYTFYNDVLFIVNSIQYFLKLLYLEAEGRKKRVGNKIIFLKVVPYLKFENKYSYKNSFIKFSF